MALTQEQILESIDTLTVLELSEFILKFEVRYGVTAAAPAAAAALVEEQTEFTAILAEIGPNKIPVIKVVRELTGLGLKEAVTKEEAEKIKAALEEQGAKVEIK